MLHDIALKIANYRNVYVNVTSYFVLESNFSKCLCECYMIFCFREQLLEMFMWMLHDVPLYLDNFAKCLCLCECYFYFYLFFSSRTPNAIFVLHDIALKIANYRNVYVNVTSYFVLESNFAKCFCEFCFGEQLIKMFMWMLHDVTLYLVLEDNLAKCLCECYMILHWRLQTIEMILWMLLIFKE
jgi:hypothetical protein